MKREITIKSKSGKDVNYSIIAEKNENKKGCFNLYVTFKNTYKVNDYPKKVNNENYYYLNNPDLNKELGLNNNQDVCLPFFDKHFLINEIKKEIIESNEMIDVSYLKNHADYVVDYDLKYNLSKKESEQYKISENDSYITYKIPAQNLYIKRNKKEIKDYTVICAACEHEYSSNESIVFKNGRCPKCGF